MFAVWRIAVGLALYAAAIFSGWHALYLLLVGLAGTVVAYAMLGWVEQWVRRRFATAARTLQS